MSPDKKDASATTVVGVVVYSVGKWQTSMSIDNSQFKPVLGKGAVRDEFIWSGSYSGVWRFDTIPEQKGR